MHMRVIYVGRHLSRTLKKSPCPGRGSNQRCKTRIRFNLYILYYKVYNSSCSQVGHDLIDRVESSSKQKKLQFLFASTFYVTMEVLHAQA